MGNEDRVELRGEKGPTRLLELENTQHVTSTVCSTHKRVYTNVYTHVYTYDTEHTPGTHQQHTRNSVQGCLPSPPFVFSPIALHPTPTPHRHPTATPPSPHSPHSPRFKAAADDATIARALARGHMLVDENLLENPALRELQVI